jgi:hypothetical protein
MRISRGLSWFSPHKPTYRSAPAEAVAGPPKETPPALETSSNMRRLRTPLSQRPRGADPIGEQLEKADVVIGGLRHPVKPACQDEAPDCKHRKESSLGLATVLSSSRFTFQELGAMDGCPLHRHRAASPGRNGRRVSAPRRSRRTGASRHWLLESRSRRGPVTLRPRLSPGVLLWGCVEGDTARDTGRQER